MTEIATSVRSVSICFPAYNEEATIEAVLREADQLLRDSELDYEILVANDASRDRTGDIIRGVADELPNFRLIEHDANRGIRATFEHLYAESTKDWVFLNSTDGQWPTAVLFELIDKARDADIVIASRTNKHYGFVRRFVSSAFNCVPPLLFGVRTYDAGAVKLVRREIIDRFEIVSKSPFNEAERLIKAARAGYRIVNHPVDTSPRRGGKAGGARWTLVREAVADVWRVWRSLRRS